MIYSRVKIKTKYLCFWIFRTRGL